MERISVVVANWKMALSHKGAVEAASALKNLLKSDAGVCDVVVCPSFPSLAAVAETLKTNTKIKVGAQNVHWEEKGSWTGEVSVLQVKPFVTWCIVGHSERRQHFGETDKQVVQKMNLLLKHGIIAIVCMGETAAEREAGQAVAVVTKQARAVLAALTLTSLRQVVLAYEPVWAIGSGVTPEPDEAAEIMLLVRKVAGEFFGADGAQRLRILYGGSVTSETAEQFAAEPGIDGVLVGGFSVRPMQLVDIIQRVQRAQA
jgi:triosephosphate isomerase